MGRACSSSRGHGVARAQDAPQNDAVPDAHGEQGREGRTVPTAPGRGAGTGSELSAAQRAAIAAAVLALPPMTQEQLAGVDALIVARRLRRPGRRSPGK
jgi:hypothetical protein